MASDNNSSIASFKRQAWFCTTGLPSDVVIQVDHMTFHLHKFPLMSKSKKLHDLITRHEQNQFGRRKRTSSSDDVEIDDLKEDDDDDDDDEDGGECNISLTKFPGGAEIFETAAKFCYSVKIELTAAKAAPLRCAAEALEMTEDYSENNLVMKTEMFLNQNVFNSIRDSIKSLKSCENVYQLAENLGIVQRCIHCITLKSALYDPVLFGWPVNDSTTSVTGREPPWVEDLAKLSSPLFNSVFSAMRENGIKPEVLESCLVRYAKRCFPRITRSTRKSHNSTSMLASEAEERELLQNIISNLPSEKTTQTSTPATTKFLFGLLRMASILNVSELYRSVLERRIGAQLDQAALDDLLIPSYSYLNETLYDVDCVERILGYFLEFLEKDEMERGNRRYPGLMVVGKLIDGYLSEIASDSNLKPEKFCDLAVLLPDQARVYNDGVYRAVDVYLKAHPWISEEEREDVIGVMNYEKLTLEACTHAAQNERLPLRAVVQVLFFEQLQLRHAIAGTLDEGRQTPHHIHHKDGDVREDRWRATMRENQVLRLDMDSMRTRVHELERECSSMKKVINKIGTPLNESRKGLKKGGFGNKFGCKFKTQVCDSHESTVVEDKKRR